MQQVLGLTYESVLPEVLDQYLGTIFKPLRPLMLYGRDASQQPQCKPKEAVYWGWKDTVWGVGCGMWGVGCGVWGVGWDGVATCMVVRLPPWPSGCLRGCLPAWLPGS